MNPNRLLVVDDEADICELVKDLAERMGFEVETVTRADAFMASYSDCNPTVIVLDLHMPGTDGIELLRLLAEKQSSAHILLISGTDARVLSTTQRLGKTHGLNMLGSIQKPIAVSKMELMLTQVMQENRSVNAEELRKAIETGQLVVHYQPKIELTREDGWDITACEALVRWQHPHHGLMPPVAFIPLAEETQLIAPLTDFVLNEAIEQTRRWHDEKLSLSMAVNIAPQLLTDLELPDRISDLLAAHGVDPSNLILEITESGAMADAATTMEILTRFRLKGYGLSIDDFGTGYSSLVQLHRMPFNEMKIDKSFVIEMERDEEAKNIVESIVNLAHSIGLTLCAEGVESETSLQWLRSVGCEKAQGYHIGKPVPPKAFAALVGESKRQTGRGKGSA